MSRDAPKRMNLTAQQSQERILVILARNKGMPTKFSTIAQAYRDFSDDDCSILDSTIKLRCKDLLHAGLVVIFGGTGDNALYRLTNLGVSRLPEELQPTTAQLSAGDIGAHVAAIQAQRHRVSLADVFEMGQRQRAESESRWPSATGPSIMVTSVKRQPPRPSRARAARDNRGSHFSPPVIGGKRGEEDSLRTAQITRALSGGAA